MRTALLLTLALLLLGAAAPLAGQTAGARMTASATVVEPGGVHTGTANVGRVANGHVEVAMPLDIGGRVPRVVTVVEGDAVTGTLLSPRSGLPGSGAVNPSDPAAPAPTVRTALPVLPPSADAAPRTLRYVVSHIN